MQKKKLAEIVDGLTNGVAAAAGLEAEEARALVGIFLKKNAARIVEEAAGKKPEAPIAG